MQRFVLTVFIMIMAAGTVPAWGLELGGRAYFWRPDLKGDIRVDENGLTGTKLDFVDTLAIDDESSAVVEAFFGIGKHHLMLGFYQVDYKGTKQLNQEVVFNGESYPVGDTIHSEMDLRTVEGMYQYDIIDLENILAGFSVGLVGKVKVLSGSAQIRSELSAEQTNKDFTAPIPMLGANVHIGLIAQLLEARALVTGIGYAGNKVVDGQAEVTLTPLPFIRLTGGYRMFKIDVDQDDVEFNYTTSGPYVGAALNFSF